jgi:hypothetical protein
MDSVALSRASHAGALEVPLRNALHLSLRSLSDRHVVCVRSEDVNISGSLYRNKLKYANFKRKHMPLGCTAAVRPGCSGTGTCERGGSVAGRGPRAAGPCEACLLRGTPTRSRAPSTTGRLPRSCGAPSVAWRLGRSLGGGGGEGGGREKDGARPAVLGWSVLPEVPHKTARGAAALDRRAARLALSHGSTVRDGCEPQRPWRRLKTFEGIPHPYDRKKRGSDAALGRTTAHTSPERAFLHFVAAPRSSRNGGPEPSRTGKGQFAQSTCAGL